MVYPSPYPRNLALKIYKTSILSFRTRSQYIAGSHRFRNAYTKVTNPRKMVRVWAEKELRNLRRLADGGIRCPKVVECRENVLVMEFLGGEGDDVAKYVGFVCGVVSVLIMRQDFAEVEGCGSLASAVAGIVCRVGYCPAAHVSALSTRTRRFQ
jgi:tRNA A-37 threonylcarbamoyl transferase component Bud32